MEDILPTELQNIIGDTIKTMNHNLKMRKFGHKYNLLQDADVMEARSKTPKKNGKCDKIGRETTRTVYNQDRTIVQTSFNLSSPLKIERKLRRIYP